MKKQLFIIFLIVSLDAVAIQNWDYCNSKIDKPLSYLSESAKKGHLDGIAYLLGSKCFRQQYQSPEFNKEMAKAVFFAVNEGNLKCVQFLHELGANLDIIIEPSDLHELAENSWLLDEKTSLLGFAVAKHHWDIVKFLLNEGAARLDRGFDSRLNMIMAAAVDKNIEMFKYLLNRFHINKKEQQYLYAELFKIDADKKFSKILEKKKVATYF